MENIAILLVVLLIAKQTKTVSYNQPKFCSMVAWKPDAETFAHNGTIGQQPQSIFINNNNTVYIAAQKYGMIRISFEGNISQANNVSRAPLHPFNVFATSSNDMYAYSTYDDRSGHPAQNNQTNGSTSSSSDKYFWCCFRIWFRFCFWRSMCSPDDTQSGSGTDANRTQTPNNSNASQNDLHGNVYKWSLNTTNTTIIMNVEGLCFSLFVDINDTIYCSVTNHHKVVKKSVNENTNTSTIVAGTGVNGSAPNMLSYPFGIFVSTNFSLYVADSSNNRIQQFQLNSSNGTTIAGNPTQGTIALVSPTGVILDGNGYLFIVDSGNHRIVGSGPNGYRCVAGCSERSGAAANQLLVPTTLSFDSYGNIFVVDTGNNRVQKFLLASDSCELSYNKPKLSSCASWNPEAFTFANETTVGENVYGLFVDASNTIYVTSNISKHIYIWTSGGIIVTKNIFENTLSAPKSLFVTPNGDIFVDNGMNNQIEKWSVNTNYSVPIIGVNGSCYGLFVDRNNTIYCSMREHHQIVKKAPNTDNNTFEVAAGGSNGSAPNELSEPYGIFVHTNFSLYVADSGNNRIQLFRPGELNGTTVVDNRAAGAIMLDYPTDIVLDADGYMFIVDGNNHRIVATGPNGLRCLVGCFNRSGSALNQLNNPRSLSFDSYGNIFVADKDNHRIQKFILITNACNETVSTTDSTLKFEGKATNEALEGEIAETTDAFEDEVTETTEIRKFETLTVEVTRTTTTSVESELVTIGTSNSKIASSVFFIPTCNGHTATGISCDKLSSPCYMEAPCQNNGTCTDNDTVSTRYICQCPPYFHGSKCEDDHRLCKSDTCWNHGTCFANESNATFVCECENGWQGRHCETKVNYCENVTCHNNGVCRPLFMNYTCECLGDSYSGRHCEDVATKIVIYQIVSKSFAYVAIIAMGSVVAFLVIMDILKYGFGIDPVHEERERLRRQKRRKNRRPVIQRFVYVNAPPPESVETP